IDPDLAYGTTLGTTIYGRNATNEHLTIYAQNNSNNGASISLAGRTAAFWGDGRITYRASYNTSNDRPMHHFFRVNSSGTAQALMEIRANGDVYPIGDFVESSDARWKKDILPISNALEKILSIQGITYRWNEIAPSP